MRKCVFLLMMVTCLPLATWGQTLLYWFDEDSDHRQVVSGLTGTYALDVSALEDGLHLLHYCVMGEDGKPNGLTSAMFLKNEEQYAEHVPNKITKYKYWLNGEENTVHTVSLEQPSNPYTLVSLLPLQRMPIRSSMFHFQVDEGIPTIYAKNTFNIRFYDSQDDFVDNFMDSERTFIDYGVSQQVTNAELLESGIMATTSRPSENVIKWYYLNAEPGDSLEFKLDHAATIQVFSPTGKELYMATGAESVNWGGCHADESGKYYVALHDVASANTNVVNISYNHIDKYAIMDFDVNEIGVAESFVPITILGNGFDKIKSVGLTLNGSTITASHNLVVNKGKVVSYFPLSGEEQLGDYHLNVVFDDEEDGDVVQASSDQIHLVTPNWGELKVEVEPYLVTVSKTLVRIKVENSGNVARLYTPLTFAYDKIEAVSQIVFDNFFVSQDEDQQEDSPNPIVWTDDFTGTGTEAESMFLFIPSIKPNETVDLYASLTLSDDVNMYAVAGESLNKEVAEAKIAKANGSQGNTSDKKCTISPSLGTYLAEHTDFGDEDLLDKLEELDLSDFEKHLVKIAQKVRDITNNAIGIGRTIANIQNAIHLHHDLQVMKLSDFYTEEDRQTLLNSVHLEAPSDILNDAGHPILGAGSALWEWQQLRSTCDQDHLKGSHVPIRKSRDPNDIFGYMAESGSKAIKEGLKDISYTIEFENDPELATASAHTIVINDALDPSLFDLSTFAATGIKIGDKFMSFDNAMNFSNRTMDLRPAVNVIAQISLSFNEQTGIAKWTIESLDPMTMEPTLDALQGALPVNTDGQGLGEVLFDIRLKNGLEHEAEIPNKATIVFDENEPIETPTWTNIIDAVRPTSNVESVTQIDGVTAEVSISATDETSGPWQYDVYAQYGTGSEWVKVAEGVSVEEKATVRICGGVTNNFYSVVTDMAGNVEQKEPVVEKSLNVPIIKGDLNGDGEVTAQDASLVLQFVAGKLMFDETSLAAADINNDGQVTAQDASLILQYVAGKINW